MSSNLSLHNVHLRGAAGRGASAGAVVDGTLVVVVILSESLVPTLWRLPDGVFLPVGGAVLLGEWRDVADAGLLLLLVAVCSLLRGDPGGRLSVTDISDAIGDCPF